MSLNGHRVKCKCVGCKLEWNFIKKEWQMKLSFKILIGFFDCVWTIACESWFVSYFITFILAIEDELRELYFLYMVGIKCLSCVTQDSGFAVFQTTVPDVPSASLYGLAYTSKATLTTASLVDLKMACGVRVQPMHECSSFLLFPLRSHTKLFSNRQGLINVPW